MTQRVQEGRSGEAAARLYLEKQGLLHIQSNVKLGQGEIDLIMRDGETFVFVEVKQSRWQPEPVVMVTPQKKRRIVSATEVWLYRHGLMDASVRFDILEIVRPGGRLWVRWTKAAFMADPHEYR